MLSTSIFTAIGETGDYGVGMHTVYACPLPGLDLCQGRWARTSWHIPRAHLPRADRCGSVLAPLPCSYESLG